MPECASDKMIMEVSLQGLDGVLCSISVNTTVQCSMDIELENISKRIAMKSSAENNA
jgi:hypothetical protein